MQGTEPAEPVRRLEDEVTRQDAEIDRLRRGLAEHRYDLRYTAWRVQVIQTSRWWRTATALKNAARNRRLIKRLPWDLARAARREPRPPRPLEISGGTAQGFDESAVPVLELPPGLVARPDLTVAAIVDPIMALALRYEWNQVDAFGPEDWPDMLDRARPQLLLCESARRGNDGRWSGAVTGADEDRRRLAELVARCRDRGIPTVFWNTEDPGGFEEFVGAAALFDYVFTVDGSRIPDYRQALGHDRVDVLQFAAQPRIHNPVSIPVGRIFDVVATTGGVLAGAAPPATGQPDPAEVILEPATEFGLHLLGTWHEPVGREDLPPALRPYLVGALPYERQLAADKLYKVALNVDSVGIATGGCPRRLFELAAAATPVISGYSAAIPTTFGDLIAISASADETRALLAGLLNSKELRDRRAHLAMREVLSRHTYAHRVDAMLDAVGRHPTRHPPEVSVLLPTCRADQVPPAIEQVARQAYRPVQLVLVLHGLDLDVDAVTKQAHAAGLDNVVVLAADRSLTLGACLNLGITAADGDLLAKFDDDNRYGPHYLTDLVAAFSYTDAGVVGKGAHYSYLSSSGATVLQWPTREHRYVRTVQGGSIVAAGDVLRDLRFEDLPRAVDTNFLGRAEAAGVKIYAADRFSYVSVRQADRRAHTWQVPDEHLLRSGQVMFYGPPDDHVLF